MVEREKPRFDEMDLRKLFDDYLHKVQEAQAKAKPADGLLGMGGGVKDDPCHEWLDQQVQEMLADLDSVTPGMIAVVLKAEREYTSLPCAQWMMIAVQRHALPLIPTLGAAKAKELLEWYTAAYPPFHRLPVQKEIVRQLRSWSRR